MMSISNSFEGKWVMITGASQGIGLEMVRSFSAAGANIIACLRIKTEAIQEYLIELGNLHNVQIKALYFDLLDEGAIKQAMLELYKDKIHVDVLVNNAGIISTSLLGMTSLDVFKNVFQVNFFAAVQITQAIVKLMMRQRSGVIISLGSIAGLDPFSGYTAYGASKAALMQFTKTLAADLSPYGIRANSIAPALVQTAMAETVGVKGAESIFVRSSVKRIAQPSEISEIAIFLASEKAALINGQTIRVDGGM